MSMYVRVFFTASIALALLTVPLKELCAQVPDDIFDEEPVSSGPPLPDPFETFNRYMFDFNDQLYEDLIQPAANFYTDVVPAAPRRGIANFFRNLGYPQRFVGNVLQGNFDGAVLETREFLVNSIAGVGGIFDAAGTAEVEHFHAESLDRAFATWGVGPGAYLVLPFIGPTTIRQSVADGLSSYFLYPPAYLNETAYRVAVGAFDTFQQTPRLMDNYFSVRDGAIDPYIAVRDYNWAFRARGLHDRETPASVQFLHQHQARPDKHPAVGDTTHPAAKRQLPPRAQRPAQRRWH